MFSQISTLNRHILQVHKVDPPSTEPTGSGKSQQLKLSSLLTPQKPKPIVKPNADKPKDSNKIECKSCARIFESDRILKLHLKYVHSDEGETVTEAPNKPPPATAPTNSISEVTELESSEIEEIPNKFKCGTCTNTFPNNTVLIKHIQMQHDRKKKSKENDEHRPKKYSITTVHINSSTFKLTFQKTLVKPLESNPEEHQNHKSNPEDSDHNEIYSIVRCGACDDSYSDYTNLIEHMQAKHLKNKVIENSDESSLNHSDDELSLSTLLARVKSKPAKDPTKEHNYVDDVPLSILKSKSTNSSKASMSRLNKLNGLDKKSIDSDDEDAVSSALECLNDTNSLLTNIKAKKVESQVNMEQFKSNKKQFGQASKANLPQSRPHTPTLPGNKKSRH